MITRSTLEAMFNPNNKALVKRLKALNYTDEDLKDVSSFYELLNDCPECRISKKTNDRLTEANMDRAWLINYRWRIHTGESWKFEEIFTRDRPLYWIFKKQEAPEHHHIISAVEMNIDEETFKWYKDRLNGA